MPRRKWINLLKSIGVHLRLRPAVTFDQAPANFSKQGVTVMAKQEAGLDKRGDYGRICTKIQKI